MPQLAGPQKTRTASPPTVVKFPPAYKVVPFKNMAINGISSIRVPGKGDEAGSGIEGRNTVPGLSANVGKRSACIYGRTGYGYGIYCAR